MPSGFYSQDGVDLDSLFELNADVGENLGAIYALGHYFALGGQDLGARYAPNIYWCLDATPVTSGYWEYRAAYSETIYNNEPEMPPTETIYHPEINADIGSLFAKKGTVIKYGQAAAKTINDSTIATISFSHTTGTAAGSRTFTAVIPISDRFRVRGLSAGWSFNVRSIVNMSSTYATTAMGTPYKYSSTEIGVPITVTWSNLPVGVTAPAFRIAVSVAGINGGKLDTCADSTFCSERLYDLATTITRNAINISPTAWNETGLLPGRTYYKSFTLTHGYTGVTYTWTLTKTFGTGTAVTINAGQGTATCKLKFSGPAGEYEYSLRCDLKNSGGTVIGTVSANISLTAYTGNPL